MSRIINPTGEFNVRRRGTTWRDVHPYLFMINAPWPVFAGFIFGGYLVANVFFALIYVKIGVQHLQGADTKTPLDQFFSAFFFSAQTFTTVGYGRISPDGVLDQSWWPRCKPFGIDGARDRHGPVVRTIIAARSTPGIQPTDGGGALSIQQPACNLAWPTGAATTLWKWRHGS